MGSLSGVTKAFILAYFLHQLFQQVVLALCKCALVAIPCPPQVLHSKINVLFPTETPQHISFRSVKLLPVPVQLCGNELTHLIADSSLPLSRILTSFLTPAHGAI